MGASQSGKDGEERYIQELQEDLLQDYFESFNPGRKKEAEGGKKLPVKIYAFIGAQDRGFVIVQFDTPEEAERYKNYCNGKRFDNRTVRADFHDGIDLKAGRPQTKLQTGEFQTAGGAAASVNAIPQGTDPSQECDDDVAMGNYDIADPSQQTAAPSSLKRPRGPEGLDGESEGQKRAAVQGVQDPQGDASAALPDRNDEITANRNNEMADRNDENGSSFTGGFVHGETGNDDWLFAGNENSDDSSDDDLGVANEDD